MAFRDRLLATLRAAQPVLEQPGVMVVGSEVPNLLEANAASTLVVSLDLDIGVPVGLHAAVKQRLAQIRGLTPSADEPSVWVPDTDALLELNFVGIDASSEPRDAYVLEDDELPLMVFGALSLIREGTAIDIDGVRVPVPRLAGLLLEKLVTERTGNKGDRDLLVALALLLCSTEADLDELEDEYRALAPEYGHAVCSNLTVLSLMQRVSGMPDPEPERDRIAQLLRRLEALAS